MKLALIAEVLALILDLKDIVMGMAEDEGAPVDFPDQVEACRAKRTGILATYRKDAKKRIKDDFPL